MAMFAQIFSIATSSVTKQRVISENDQKARSISTVIRADLAKRTFTYPFPFYPGEDSATSPTPFGSRAGYIYLNTNDPASYSDDFIQITVNSILETENTDTAEYYGAAVPLTDRVTSISSLGYNPNQPDVDGGSLAPDSSSSSPAAQIAYFVRNGNLYRRVVLIRNPIDIAGRELDSQPTSNDGNNFFAFVPAMGPPDGKFQDFKGNLSNDFATYFDFSVIANSPGTTTQSAQFLGMNTLSNELTSAGAATESLGNPLFRYGFDQFTGLSREFDNNVDRYFIGRYTQAETSTPCFNWPQRQSTLELSFTAQNAVDSSTVLGSGNPNDIVGCPVSLDLNTGLVRQFNGKDDLNDPSTIEGRGGRRQMEDLLLANVQEMRLEIWDDRVRRFVVPGYGSVGDADFDANGNPQIGDYHIRRNLQLDAASAQFWNGPLAPYSTNPGATPRESDRQPHIFDTWHPALGADTTGDGIPDGINFDGAPGIALHEALPPYMPFRFSPPRRPLGPSSAIMPDDVPSATSINRGSWTANTLYAVGDVVFTPWIDGSGATAADGLFSYDEMAEPTFAIAYRCIDPGTTGIIRPSAASAGQRISDGSVNPVVWESFDNRVPLKTIRMTLRFVNSSSGDPRHLTLVLPLGE